MITTDDESKRVDFHFERGKVTTQARGPESGTSEVDMSLPGYDGPEIDIGFDLSSLLERVGKSCRTATSALLGNCGASARGKASLARSLCFPRNPVR